MLTFVSLFCLCTSLLVLQYVRSRHSSGLPLPPGPSFLQICYEWIHGGKDIAQTFQGWNKQYGPVVYARVGVKTLIILGTRQAAHDLLEKRAAIYSSRGPSIFLDKYLHRGLASAFMPYGTTWRLHRRLHASFLNIKASKGYRCLQEAKSGSLMHGFLLSNEYSDLFYQYTSNIMYSLAYRSGEKDRVDTGCNDDDDHQPKQHQRLHQINEMATFILQNASKGMILLDIFPLLDRIPTRLLMGWRDKARELHNRTKEVYIECADTALGEACWNWSAEADKQRMEGDDTELSWEEICYSIGELYVAGIHTTKMVLELFVEACMQHPGVMKKAQKEVDSVVGADRLPSFGDVEKLPYIAAFISELLRRRPISPLGVPHMVTQDDQYLGYRIPAGTIIVANQMGMNMDEAIFGDPETFNPDRYIHDSSLPSPATFGFGRRQCPGHHIAQANLFIVISRLFWGFDIHSAKHGTAEKAHFSVRSAEHRKTIEKVWVKANEDECINLEDAERIPGEKKA